MVSQAMVPTNGTNTGIENYSGFSRPEIDLIKQTVAKGASDLELKLFLADARRRGLDPFAKQIYCIMRSGKATIQTSIDGYRLIADRSGAYAGSDDPVFTGDGKKPDTATVTVWKIVQGQRCPFTATARWSEYYQEAGGMWNRMPHTMLGKCAEALALRKAFPAELSGIYTHDEMVQAGGPVIDQATGEVIDPPKPAPSAGRNRSTQQATLTVIDGQKEADALASKPLGPNAIASIVNLASRAGLGQDDLTAMVAAMHEGRALSQLTRAEGAAISERLNIAIAQQQQQAAITDESDDDLPLNEMPGPRA